MDPIELLNLAQKNGNTTLTTIIIIYLLASGPGVFLYRRYVQGRNGNASLRGQIDGIERTMKRVERTTQETHDQVITQGVRIDRAERDIQILFGKTERGRD